MLDIPLVVIPYQVRSYQTEFPGAKKTVEKGARRNPLSSQVISNGPKDRGTQ